MSNASYQQVLEGVQQMRFLTDDNPPVKDDGQPCTTYVNAGELPDTLVDSTIHALNVSNMKMSVLRDELERARSDGSGLLGDDIQVFARRLMDTGSDYWRQKEDAYVPAKPLVELLGALCVKDDKGSALYRYLNMA
jgi:hypothetical protein